VLRLTQTVHGKRRGERSGKPDLRLVGSGSGEAIETQESIGPAPPSGWLGVRIPTGSNTLKPRVIVTSWSSEQQDTMFRNGRKGLGAERRTALWGGKALKGEPQERYRPSWPEGKGGRKPPRG
jgi:hypothetical protein